MELFGTPPSPFTRKVRIFLDELGLSCDFKLITELLSIDSASFGGNPLLLFPVLVDGHRRVFDSSLICQYLCERYGSASSTIQFLPSSVEKFTSLQRLTIINGAMDAGVKIVRARRSEIPDFEKYVFFKQERAALKDALDWLEKDFPEGKNYYSQGLTSLEVSLKCLLDWGQFRELIPQNLSDYPKLKGFNEYHQERPSLLKTHPALGA